MSVEREMPDGTPQESKRILTYLAWVRKSYREFLEKRKKRVNAELTMAVRNPDYKPVVPPMSSYFLKINITPVEAAD